MSACDRALDCTELPDACTNDVREEKLIKRQQKHDGRPWIQRAISRDRNLIIACVVLIILLNMTAGWYILYGFRILGTWIHEMCHGMAALLMGGRIAKLQIFKDGSGLAYTATSGTWRQGFVSSGGYPGTAVTGCLMLLFRRTTLGPTIATIGLGVCMVFSCIMWVRNKFGLICLSLEGIGLIYCGWKLPAFWLDNLYNFMSATIALNAVESIQELFASGNYMVGGEVSTTTDAHSVAEKWGGDYRMWATIWLCMSFIMTGIGILCAFDARENNIGKALFKNSTTQALPSSSPSTNTYTPSSSTNYTAASTPAPVPVPVATAVATPVAATPPYAANASPYPEAYAHAVY